MSIFTVVRRNRSIEWEQRQVEVTNRVNYFFIYVINYDKIRPSVTRSSIVIVNSRFRNSSLAQQFSRSLDNPIISAM